MRMRRKKSFPPPKKPKREQKYLFVGTSKGKGSPLVGGAKSTKKDKGKGKGSALVIFEIS